MPHSIFGIIDSHQEMWGHLCRESHTLSFAKFSMEMKGKLDMGEYHQQDQFL